MNSLYDAATDLSATAADIAADIADGRECPGHLEHARELLATLSGAASGTARPTVVCLCGSTRFGEEFRAANLRLTLAGQIVLSIGCDARRDDDLAAMAAAGNPADVKARLDQLHLRKIDLADYVLIINPGGYVGESTRSEITYALASGKPVHYLEPWACPDDLRPREWTCTRCGGGWCGFRPADGVCPECQARPAASGGRR